MEIKKLKSSFKRDGFIYQQYTRLEGRAIYTVNYLGRVLGYEVIKVRKHPPTSRLLQPFEVYPSDEEFGYNAWSCSNLDTALAIYRGLK